MNGTKILDDIRAEFVEAIRPVWEGLLITEEPEEVIPLISINNIPVICPGEHTLLLGKKKTRKSLFVSWLLSHHPAEAIIFDTEQSRRSAWRVGNRIQRMTGIDVPVISLRGQSPANRRQIILETIRTWEPAVRLVVIDGIRDLMSNINDEKESSDVVVWLETLVRDHNVGIINVLHLNKTSDTARGHIGTELQNKGYCSVELALDQKSALPLSDANRPGMSHLMISLSRMDPTVYPRSFLCLSMARL